MKTDISDMSRTVLDSLQRMNPDAFPGTIETAFWCGYKQRILEEMTTTMAEIQGRRIDTAEKNQEDARGDR